MRTGLTFGIYPGSGAGTDNSTELASGAPDNAVLIREALVKLQPTRKQFLVRCYLHYIGFGKTKNHTPENPIQYVAANRKLDLVLGYQSKNGDINDWTAFVRQQIAHYGEHLAKIQLAEEPNLRNMPAVDGDSPNVHEAVIQGVIAAKDEAHQRGLPIEVGFNGILTFDSNNNFWRKIGDMATPAFFDSLDYVGLDFFPDVFRPISQEELSPAIQAGLQHYRTVSLAEAKIPDTVPIHITENGWATSPDRSAARQAEVLETVIRTIHACRAAINITHYELFDLRDADSKNPNIFYQFGIMRDDYSPKPAFEVYRKLIAELGV